MRFKKVKYIFSYSLSNAWGIPIASIDIENSLNNKIHFSVHDGFAIVKLGTLIINPTIIDKVKDIILESKVYEIKEVEKNEEKVVVDGYEHRFNICLGTIKSEIKVNNLGSYIEDPLKYPKVTALRELLKNISKVLVPEISILCLS